MNEREFNDHLLALIEEAKKIGKDAERTGCYAVGAAYRSGLVKVEGRIRMRQTLISSQSQGGEEDGGSGHHRAT